MAKPGFFEDTFEKLAELGSSTGKKTIQAVSQTFSPLKLTEKILGQTDGEINQPNEQTKNKEKKGQSHTPLDFDKLKENYTKQDEQKEIALRNRLFKLVKQGEEKNLAEKKQEEERKKMIEEKEKEEEKKRKEKIKEQQQEQEIPRGKIRRSIFSPKKVAQKQHEEIKPAVGKQ